MPTNHTFTSAGSYTEGKGASAKKFEFSVEVEGYTENEAGLKAALADYKAEGIVALINSHRATKATNAERTRLTADQRKEVTVKANAWDEYTAAETDEERAAVMKKYGLGK